MSTQPHFDLCQFDSSGVLGQESALRKVLDADEIGSGFQPGKDRRIEHDVPDWALTWAGLARVALCCGGVEVLTKRRGQEINHSRRVSILYLYFRVGMSAAHIAEYLDVTRGSVKQLAHRVQRDFDCVTLQTPIGETAQLRHTVKRFMLGREKDLSGTRPVEVQGTGPGLASPLETPKELRAKRAERKLEPEIWNELRMKALDALRLGAPNAESILRPRRRSQWKTSDAPARDALQMWRNIGRKIHRAARVQLKAQVLRRLDDIGENIPRLPSRRCRHGIYGADTCAVCIALPDSVVFGSQVS
jgi:hypothetical protein